MPRERSSRTEESEPTTKVMKRAMRVMRGAGNCLTYADASGPLDASRASKTCSSRCTRACATARRVVAAKGGGGGAAAELLGVLEEGEDEHEDDDKGREEQVEAAAQHEAPPQVGDVARERLADPELLVEHRVEDREVEVPLEDARHAEAAVGAGEREEAAERRVEREQLEVHQHHQEVLLAQDAVRDVVRGQLVLDDAEAARPLELDELDDDLVPRDDLEVGVLEVEPVAVERAHLVQRAQLRHELRERPRPVEEEEQEKVEEVEHAERRRAAEPVGVEEGDVAAGGLVGALVHHAVPVDVPLEVREYQQVPDRHHRDDARSEDALEAALAVIGVDAREVLVEVGDGLPLLARRLAVVQDRDRVHLEQPPRGRVAHPMFHCSALAVFMPQWTQREPPHQPARDSTPSCNNKCENKT